MMDIKIGDLIIARRNGKETVKNENGREFETRPFEYGKVVFLHPDRLFVVYDNGKYNTTKYMNEFVRAEDFDPSVHPSVPVYNRLKN